MSDQTTVGKIAEETKATASKTTGLGGLRGLPGSFYTAVLAAMLLLSIVLVIVLSKADMSMADAIRGEFAREGLSAAVDTTLSFYDTWTKTLLSGFGIVAFLMTYAQKSDLRPTPGAWAAVATGLVLLFGAVALTWVGRERVLMMVVENAVNLELQMLLVARWFSYLLAAASLGLFGIFAIELANRR